MNTVQPVRKKEDIHKIKSILLKKNKRDYLLFVLGINCGLRVSDLLTLRIRDIKDKEFISIREKKTGKEKLFPVNKAAKAAFDLYIREYRGHYDLDEYLFISRKGENKPINRIMAYKIISEAAKKAGVSNIGTHSLRKTWGYQARKSGASLILIKEALNHDDSDDTLRYIGVTQDEVNEIYHSVNL